MAAGAIAIVGAGYSGTLLALHLLEHGPFGLRVSLIEKSAGFGRGLAYATHNPRHMLNVRVGNMSAWPEAPDHLAEWLAANGRSGVDATGFISRGDYGRYIGALLEAEVSHARRQRRLLLEHDEAIEIQPIGRRFRLTMAMGRWIKADAVVLAVGHQPPAPPTIAGLEALDATRYVGDPWSPAATADLPDDAPVLFLGSGLTMVDVAIALDAQGHRGAMLAMSRRGLIPRRHSGPMALADGRSLPVGSLSRRLAAVRRRADVIGWRGAIDELRPATQALWRQATLEERRRFLRHLQPWWDVHRHRMAPTVADWFEAQQAAGRLSVEAGRALSVERIEDGVRVRWRRRGAGGDEVATVARIINCTGPGGALSQSGNPLLRRLIASGAARSDPLALGLDVDAQGRVVDARGAPNPGLFAVGPITRGAFWEVTAVPDIRNQVAALGAVLASLPGERAA
jgi:uncharacterized NAD(P)/FAD-binding protein YdhS